MCGPLALPNTSPPCPTMSGTGWCDWFIADGWVGSASVAALAATTAAALLSIILSMLNMASIMEAVWSFKATISAVICSYTSSISPVTLVLEWVWWGCLKMCFVMMFTPKRTKMQWVMRQRTKHECMLKKSCRSIGFAHNFEQRHRIEPNSFLLRNKHVHLVKI